jgi:hypothetical protein
MVLHLVVDWLGQNDWIAVNKVNLRHPAGWVHGLMHGAVQLLVFPWWAALAIGACHVAIDTRRPVAWWSRLIRQTQPRALRAVSPDAASPEGRPYKMDFDGFAWQIQSAPRDRTEALEQQLDDLRRDMVEWTVPVYDLGTEVRIWSDQVWHIATVALAAVLVTL